MYSNKAVVPDLCDPNTMIRGQQSRFVGSGSYLQLDVASKACSASASLLFFARPQKLSLATAPARCRHDTVDAHVASASHRSVLPSATRHRRPQSPHTPVDTLAIASTVGQGPSRHASVPFGGDAERRAESVDGPLLE